MVLQELAPSQAHKIKSRKDLESELFGEEGSDAGSVSIRDNEGEAAEYGVYFDDTEYDYMQHIRGDDGQETLESYVVEAPQTRGKGKVKLEDALRNASLNDTASQSGAATNNSMASLLDDDILPSKYLKRSTYQDQQDVPDALAGFQPDMDPRLREVLHALDDEAYVDDDDDVFGELTKDGKEVGLDQFEDLEFESEAEDDEGWKTDDTARPKKEYKNVNVKISEPAAADVPMADGPDHGDGDWMKEFSKFKKAEATKKAKPQAPHQDLQSSIMTGSSMTGGRRKKRKGAMTSSTGYSMTSSALARTEGLTTLDARFDKIEERYAEDDMDDDGGVSVVTDTSTTSSQAPQLRSDFDSIMDDFLGGYSMAGKKRLKRGGRQTGMEQLDEVRQGLGPARIELQKPR